MAKGIGRNGELFRQICDPGYLMRCTRRAARGKRHKRDVSGFLLNLEPNCFELAKLLATEVWSPGAYKSFWIHDPKRRLISAAPFADRVVHQALVGILEPHFERRFIFHSYACRRGKGTHRALRQAVQWSRQYRYVLKGDIAKFFPSMDHEVVKACLRSVIHDRSFLDVMERVVDRSNPQEYVQLWFSGDDLLTPLTRRVGLPIGNLTSQFLANVVLDRLDHEITDRWGAGAYLRYCDDFLVFADDKDALWETRGRIEQALAGLRLKLHARKGGVHSCEAEVPFLGFTVQKGRVRLGGRSIRRATLRLRKLHNLVLAQQIAPQRLSASVCAWLSHAGQATGKGLQRRVLARAGVGACLG